MERLKKKIAIVTGGSRGIGEAIATAFAMEGARVVIASRKQEGLDAVAAKINALAPGTVWAKACHLGDVEQIAELVAWTTDTVGLPNVLVNNSATNPHFGPMMSVQPSAWDKTFEVNVRGAFEATKQVVERLMVAGAAGSIINVASIAGLSGAPLQGVYGMTKAAIISMTRTLAVELGPSHLRVNAIAPGLVETRFASALVQSKEILAMYNQNTALQRHAQPHEIAGLAVFLASDEASYVTGQVYRVDGGYGLR